MTDTTSQATRWLRGYDKKGDRLIEEVPLRPISLSELRHIFDTAEDDPMVDSYPVSATHAARLGQYLPKPLNLWTLDYFLECDAEVE